jgi:hypothetical protein
VVAIFYSSTTGMEGLTDSCKHTTFFLQIQIESSEKWIFARFDIEKTPQVPKGSKKSSLF